MDLIIDKKLMEIELAKREVNEANKVKNDIIRELAEYLYTVHRVDIRTEEERNCAEFTMGRVLQNVGYTKGYNFYWLEVGDIYGLPERGTREDWKHRTVLEMEHVFGKEGSKSIAPITEDKINKRTMALCKKLAKKLVSHNSKVLKKFLKKLEENK